MNNLSKLSIIAALCSIASIYSSEQLYGASVVRKGVIIDQLPAVEADLNEYGLPTCFYLKTDGTQDVDLANGDQIATAGTTYMVKRIDLRNNSDHIQVTLQTNNQSERDLYAHRKDDTVRRYTRN